MIILDIWNKYYGCPKFNRPSTLFQISKVLISDVQNNDFGYPE